MLAFEQLAVVAEPPRAVTRIDDRDPAAAIRSLVIRGCTAAEAGNLVAYGYGLRPAASGWTSHQIRHVLFLRLLADSGRID